MIRRLLRCRRVRRMTRLIRTLDAVDLWLELAQHFPVAEPVRQMVEELEIDTMADLADAGVLATALERRARALAIGIDGEPIRLPWARDELPTRWWERDLMAAALRARSGKVAP